MRRLTISVALAILATLAITGPANAGDPSAYLAYKIRVMRGETYYKLDAGLTRLATTRAKEIALGHFGHRQLTEVNCNWGEILGWSANTRIQATRWIAKAWRNSPTHWTVLRSPWRYYGVGTYYRNGVWFMAVVFAQCKHR